MLEDLVVLVFVLALAFGPVIYGFRVSKKRKNVRSDRARLAREVLSDAKVPFVKDKMMGPDKSWVEAQNDLRRRRQSIPRVKSHI